MEKMNVNIEEAMAKLFDKLAGMDPNTEEYKQVLNELVALTNKHIEYKKIDAEKNQKSRDRIFAKEKLRQESDLKRAELELKESELNLRRDELDERIKTRKSDAQIKAKERRNDMIRAIITAIVDLAKYFGGGTLCVLILKMALTYEENGTIASPIGRAILKMFIPSFKV